MDSGGLPKKDPQTPAICPKCGSPGHNDSAKQLSTNRILHRCSNCDECFCTVPNAKSKQSEMTGFYSINLKAVNACEKEESHYQCLLCNKMFRTLADRNTHMGKHTGVETHMCTQCGFVSNQESIAASHVATHSRQHSHKCPVCCQAFGTYTEIDQHLSSHLGDTLHRCTQCSFASPVRSVQAQMMTLCLVQSEAKRHAGVITQNINIQISYSCLSESNQPALSIENNDSSLQGESPNVPLPIKSEIVSVSDDDSQGNEVLPTAESDHTEVQTMLSNCSEQRDDAISGKSLHSDKGENSKRNFSNLSKDHIQSDEAGSTQPTKAKSRVKGRRLIKGKYLRKPKGSHKSHWAQIYKCSICNRQFGHEEWLKRHMGSHVKCFLCKMMFSSPDELNEHMLTHTAGKEIKCTICDKWFSDLPTHLKTHARNINKMSAEECTEAASAQDDTVEQVTDKPIKSIVTKKEYISTQENTAVPVSDQAIKSIVSEKESVEPEKPYKCPICGKGFMKKSYMMNHKATHTRENSHVCSLCGQKSANPLSFRRHMERHMVEKQHQCSYCGKRVSTAASLSEHIATQHAVGEKSYQCTQCDRQFPSKAYLRKHVKSHSTVKPHACPHCDQRYRSLGLLNRHMGTHTDNYKCMYCGKRLCDAATLKQHEMVHTGETPYPCSQCPKRFRDKSRLNEHILTHSAERPHMCSVCGKTFASEPRLRAHMKIHSDHRPHACSQCDKTFYHRGALKVHMGTHTGEKPFLCNECGRSFAAKKSFLKHSHEPKRRGRKKKPVFEELTETAVAVSSLDQPLIYGGAAHEPYSVTVEVISDG